MSQKSPNLTRTELADAIFRKLGVTHTEASNLVDQVLQEMTQGLMGGGEVKITNFGTFTAKMRGARLGRNPKTGMEVKIEPHYAVSFKPAQELRDNIDLNLKNLKGMPE